MPRALLVACVLLIAGESLCVIAGLPLSESWDVPSELRVLESSDVDVLIVGDSRVGRIVPAAFAEGWATVTGEIPVVELYSLEAANAGAVLAFFVGRIDPPQFLLIGESMNSLRSPRAYTEHRLRESPAASWSNALAWRLRRWFASRLRLYLDAQLTVIAERAVRGLAEPGGPQENEETEQLLSGRRLEAARNQSLLILEEMVDKRVDPRVVSDYESLLDAFRTLGSEPSLFRMPVAGPALEIETEGEIQAELQTFANEVGVALFDTNETLLGIEAREHMPDYSHIFGEEERRVFSLALGNALALRLAPGVS